MSGPKFRAMKITGGGGGVRDFATAKTPEQEAFIGNQAAGASSCS